MIEVLKTSGTWALSIITTIFTFAPESVFKVYKLMPKFSDETNIAINRTLAFVATFILSVIINSLFLFFRRSVNIKGKNYNIQIKEKDLFDMKNCKKIITFDECFSTKVGNDPEEIKPGSICGQYLTKNPMSDDDIQKLIDKYKLKQSKTKSKYQSKNRYDSGKLLQNEDYLLMSFAKLDKNGSGNFTRDEFLDALSTLWKEIDIYYGQNDVCIPIIGSGITRIDGTELTQQELLEIIIFSYKLSKHKIKLPYKLIIVYKKCDGFSLNKIGQGIL